MSCACPDPILWLLGHQPAQTHGVEDNALDRRRLIALGYRTALEAVYLVTSQLWQLLGPSFPINDSAGGRAPCSATQRDCSGPTIGARSDGLSRRRLHLTLPVERPSGAGDAIAEDDTDQKALVRRWQQSSTSGYRDKRSLGALSNCRALIGPCRSTPPPTRGTMPGGRL